jgi:hypothetical protein
MTTALVCAAFLSPLCWLGWRRISGRRPIVGQLLPPSRDLPIYVEPRGGRL